MDSVNLEDTLKKISDQIDQFADTNKLVNVVHKPETSDIVSKIPKINALTYYGLIPVGILIILFIWKPQFLTIEEPNEDGTFKVKVDYSKLLGWTLCFTTLVAIGIFAFYYNQKKQVLISA
jgi:hypothetical protein